jgi:hypothetical protein
MGGANDIAQYLDTPQTRPSRRAITQRSPSRRLPAATERVTH